MTFITDLFNHYGYIVLFVALTLELIALPTPGETLMIYCGFLVYQGQLNWILSIIVATAGIITGITTSYYLGSRLGNKFFAKYGSYVHMGPDKLEKTSIWFGKYGNGLLVISYFIPGVRHITGYFAGITKISYKKFALNAYAGAIIWSGVFISLGKALGSQWEQFHVLMKRYLIIGGIIIGVIVIGIYLYKSYKQHLIKTVEMTLVYCLKIFHSLGRVRIVVLGMATIFISLVVLIAGLIQDFLANEFGKFDNVASYIIKQIFPENWTAVFRFIQYLSIYPTLLAILVFLFIWIILKDEDRFLEVRILLVTLLGGEALEEGLRIIFHRLGPLGTSLHAHSVYTFPSEQSMMTLITYGFAAYIIIRHIHKRQIGTFTIFATLVLCIFSGFSPIFLGIQYPSDVFAGYVFGGAWLSISIVVLEVLRILPTIENSKPD